MTYRGSGAIIPLILYLSTRWRWMVSLQRGSFTIIFKFHSLSHNVFKSVDENHKVYFYEGPMTCICSSYRQITSFRLHYCSVRSNWIFFSEKVIKDWN